MLLMATLDQLPAEQRAIVELVVQRGRSYDALADVLQVPEERVRELARDALGELSPRTARRVDPEWRGKVADYLLGQQSGADARATRDHLKSSESSRAWALSLLDSLDPLYGDASPPAVPEGGDLAEESEEKPEATEAKTAGNGAGAAETIEERARARTRERDRERPAKAARDDDDEPKAKPGRKKEPLRKTEERERTGSLSPAAQTALRRRRIRGAVLGVALLAAIVVAVLALTGTFSSDDSSGNSSSASTGGTSTTPAGQNPLQLLGQIALAPLNKVKAQGIAYLAQENKQRFLVVQAQVPPLPKKQQVAAYEVWLYNTNADAKSLGAQYTDAQGLLQGRANLPANYARYKFIDISREVVSDNNAGHGNASVLRGAFATIKPVPQQQQQGGAATTPGAAAPSPTPTPTTPAP